MLFKTKTKTKTKTKNKKQKTKKLKKIEIMDITYYFIGLLTGVSVTTFFIGKEWYKYYTRYTIQQKQLDRILKLNDKINTFKHLETSETPEFTVGA